MSDHESTGIFGQAFDACYVLSDPITKRKDDCRMRLARLRIQEPVFQYARGSTRLQMNNMRRNAPVEFAVNLGHIKNIVSAITHADACPLFLEDDVHFTHDAERVLYRAIPELPDDWSILYLGGHPREPIYRHSEHLVRAKTWSCAEGYAINGHWLPGFFDFWCDRISKPDAMFDFILGEYAALTETAFALYPPVTYQPDGWSYIGSKTDSKTALIERGWKNNLKGEQ